LIANRYAYSKTDVADFIQYCQGLGIDVIPLQQSFGHVEYILRHPRYKELREDQKDYSQVCPLKESLNRELFKDLFTEMAAAHPSKYFHIGGDETPIGRGTCIHLPPLVEHCLENAGANPMRVLGVFHPQGDPASRAHES